MVKEYIFDTGALHFDEGITLSTKKDFANFDMTLRFLRFSAVPAQKKDLKPARRMTIG